MPLDARKIAHIQQVVPQTWSGRQRTVVFVYASGGAHTYTPISVILKPQLELDPTIPDQRGHSPVPEVTALLIAPLSVSFSGVLCIADTTNATPAGVAAAVKYEVIEALPVGLPDGGTHYRASLRRLR
jgi:hypothetical protein